MKHKCFALFPQPLTCIENVDIEGVGEFFDEVVKKNETPEKDPTLSGPKHYHNDRNVLEMYSELHPLRDRIVEAASFAYRDVMNFSDGVRLTNAWFNECPKGHWQKTHNHANCTLSGTLYLRTGEDSKIEFFNMFSQSNDLMPCILDHPDGDRENEFGYQFHANMVTIPVKNGDCLFWPSYLNHGYPANQTEGRLSLSFNFLPVSLNSLYQFKP